MKARVVHLLLLVSGAGGAHAEQSSRIASLNPGSENNASPPNKNFLNPSKFKNGLIDLIPSQRNGVSRLFNPLDRIRNRANNRLAAFMNPSHHMQQIPSKKRQMYLTCFAIVFVWQTLGTLFYSYYYSWPLPQSFFYSVDAGMSIGFCTDVHESKVGSRAFTIIHILLGASCVGGALILMVQSVLDGVASRTSAIYKLILERDSLSKAFRGTQRGQYGASVLRHPLNWVPEKERGILSYNDFRKVLYNNGLKQITDKDFLRVCNFYDPHVEGCIRYDYFAERFEGINRIIPQSRFVHRESVATRTWYALSSMLTDESNRIYLIFVLWVAMGVIWGIRSQHWDPITATHFSISALATGGLTAPPVDKATGILPTGPALFCGFYCLFGIPLMALTMATIARVLVERYIVDEELAAITRPLTPTECKFASKSLCSTDSAIHLSDYIVLQLMRQGKLSVESFEFMKRQYQIMDQRRFWLWKVADQDPI
eukprot:scaffold7181_cov128-Skeletonema_marinoi.AAC.7